MKAGRILSLLVVSAAFALGASAQEKAPVKLAKAGAKPSAAAKPTPAPMLAEPDGEQMLAYSQAYLGAYDCEFKQAMQVTKHRVDGYVDVTFSSKTYTMKPVRSSTGALRLEEVAGGPMLLVQIPTKSMLMDTVRGRRIVDACVHEVQAKETSEANSLGMNLAGQVNTADTSAAAKR